MQTQGRIRSLSEQGKQILFVDLSNWRASEVAHIAEAVPDQVMRLPRNSVLLLVDFAGASLDAEAIRAVKEAAVFDKPYIKKGSVDRWGYNGRLRLHGNTRFLSS